MVEMPPLGRGATPPPPWRREGKSVWAGDSLFPRFICEVSEPIRGQSDTEAVARLIVAAPETLEQRDDLLAALEGLIHALTEGTLDDEDGAFATAELAITKARGG